MQVADARSRLGDSLRRLLGTTLELGQTRLRLLLTELELEKLRLFDALVWAALGLLFMIVGVVLLFLLLLMLLQDAHRLPALAVLVLLTAGVAAWMLARARRLLHGDGPMLAATLEELDRDRVALQPREE